MGSSTSPEPWIPELPDNEIEVGATMREFAAALPLMTIPELMEQATRIAEAQQRLAGSALEATLSPSSRLTAYLEQVDRAIPRSRQTANLSPRGRAAEASRSLPQPSPLPAPSTSRAFATARRIAALQARVEMRERGYE